jgi:hypothetical protein
MTKPTVRIHNSETDEVIDREMTDTELQLSQEIKTNQELNELKEAELLSNKISAYKKMNLTNAEIVAILGLSEFMDLQSLGL